MASPKIVLFIVEGETDERALGRVLSKLVTDSLGYGVKFGITRGDITSKYVSGKENPSSTIKKRVQSAARSFLNRYKLRWSDLCYIVFITDTDGAFISDELIRFNPNECGFKYFDNHIEASDTDGARIRNDIKSSCLKVLASTSSMTYSKRRVPFKAAYMSRNLEHALSDYKIEASIEKKDELAYAFNRRYGSSPAHFIRLINDIAPNGSYRDSWKYIADDTNSLKRGSNMKQVLEELGLQICMVS